MTPFQDLDVDLSFGRLYACLSCSVLLIGITLLSVSTWNLALFGERLIDPSTLVLLFVCEVIKIYASKKLSGHDRAFSLPHYSDPVRGDPTKGPLLRRTVLRFKKLVFKLKPYQKVAHGFIMLMVIWLMISYTTVCFGAPFFTEHYETASFAFLITTLTFLPSLLVFGPDHDLLERVFFTSDLKGVDPLSHLLFTNALGAILGAWVGAFPIPLDWDRPWQVWPITCCIGAIAGSLLFNVWSLIQIQHKLNRRQNSFTKLKKRS